jgi:hypothetical protein
MVLVDQVLGMGLGMKPGAGGENGKPLSVPNATSAQLVLQDVSYDCFITAETARHSDGPFRQAP